MAVIKFGPKQILNPTPANLNRVVRLLTVSGSIFLAWISTASIMGPHTKDVITQVLGLVLGLTNGLTPLFGVEIKGKVDAEQVTAIDIK